MALSSNSSPQAMHMDVATDEGETTALLVQQSDLHCSTETQDTENASSLSSECDHTRSLVHSGTEVTYLRLMKHMPAAATAQYAAITGFKYTKNASAPPDCTA